MIPVDQTLFGGEVDNCFAACVASLLEMRIDDVPNFCAVKGDWYQGLQTWLLEQNLVALTLQSLGSCEDTLTQAYHIACGPTSRGFMHSTIWRWGRLVHDPHPNREGLLRVDNYLFLIPLDISQ